MRTMIAELYDAHARQLRACAGRTRRAIGHVKPHDVGRGREAQMLDSRLLQPIFHAGGGHLAFPPTPRKSGEKSKAATAPIASPTREYIKKIRTLAIWRASRRRFSRV